MKNWVRDTYEDLDDLEHAISMARAKIRWLELTTGMNFFSISKREAKMVAACFLAVRDEGKERIYELFRAFDRWFDLIEALDEWKDGGAVEVLEEGEKAQ